MQRQLEEGSHCRYKSLHCCLCQGAAKLAQKMFCCFLSYIVSITVFVSCLGRWINCVASDHRSPLRGCLVQLSDFLLLCVCLCYGALIWLRISPHIWCFQYLICQKVCKLLCVLSVMLLLRDLLIVSENTWFLCLLDSMNESEVSLLNSIWLYE